MSGINDYSDLFEDDHEERQTGGGLRKQLEDALARVQKLEEANQQLVRKDSVGALLKEKGKDPAAVNLIPLDVDAKEWLDKNGHLLADAGKATTKTSENVPPAVETDDGEPPAAPEVVEHDPALEEERQAMETLQEHSATGIPSTATADQIQKLKSFDNEADLLKYIQSNGAVS